MSNINATNNVYFESIGQTDDLKTVSCSATNHFEVKYSSERSHIKEEMATKNSNVWNGEDKMKNLCRFKRRDDRNDGRERQYFSQTNEFGHKEKKSFWPTDLIQDETGETLRKLKSYVESHKINTYIKHDLPNLEYEERKCKNNYKVTNEYDASKTKDKNYASKRSLSENNRNKNRMLRIDYEVVTIQKEISPKKKNSFYPTNAGKSSEPKMTTERRSSSKKLMKTSDIKVSPSLSKLHDSSPKASSMTKTHQSPMNTQLKSRDEFEENLVQCKTLDVHERQYLTPNTSTYFQSLNNSIDIEPENVSPEKSRGRNHKSFIHIHKEEEEENESKSFGEKEVKTMQKLMNRSENSHATISNSKSKYKILEANNYYDSLAKYKSIINISKNS